jgi:hypothetical protein
MAIAVGDAGRAPLGAIIAGQRRHQVQAMTPLIEHSAKNWASCGIGAVSRGWLCGWVEQPG